jgi:hypothetical protein
MAKAHRYSIANYAVIPKHRVPTHDDAAKVFDDQAAAEHNLAWQLNAGQCLNEWSAKLVNERERQAQRQLP